MEHVITGRGARIQHIALEEGTLCGSPAATVATNRFTKLPVCKRCATAHIEATAADLAQQEEDVTVRLSARVARWMTTHLTTDHPTLAAALADAKLVRNGRGYTAQVTTTRTLATTLLEQMKTVSTQLTTGERTTTGMGFREEAIAKGVAHITVDLARA